MSDRVNIALQYAAAGIPVLPLTPNGKEPLSEGAFRRGYLSATTDTAVLQSFFSAHSDANFGIGTGQEIPWQRGYVLAVIDEDNKNEQGKPEKNGRADILALEAERGELPPTRTVYTASSHTGTGFRSKQYYYATPIELLDVPLKAQLAPGVDLKVHKGYVVGPSSVVNGRKYELANGSDEFVILPLPWQFELINSKRLEMSAQGWDELKRRTSLRGTTFCEKHDIDMADVMPELRNGRKTGNGVLLKHPKHGATGDGNLSVSISKNLWKCFRCDSGGDPITWIAVREGFIDCADAGPLDKETFKRCKRVAERDGLVRDESDASGLTVETRSPIVRPNENDANDDDPTEIVCPAALCYSDALFEQLCDIKESKADRTVKPLPGKITSYLLKQCRFITFEDTDEVRYYDPDDGLYHREGEKQIGNAMEVLIGDALSSRHVSEAVDHIRRRTRRARAEYMAPPTLIPTLDGVYDLNTETIAPYSPDVPFFHKHDFSYDMAVLERNPRAKRLIYSAFAKDDIEPIQELGGRCLYRAPLYKKAFMFLGEGDNGKSIFLTWLRETIGALAVCSLSLYQLIKSRFGTAQLDGMNANIYADLGGGDLYYVGMFMAMTGGDAIAVEHKGMPLFMIVPYAVQVFSTNKLPDVKDPPDQFYNRWILIEMPYTFVDEPEHPYERQREASFEIDGPNDEDKAWLGTWFIEGLKKLLRNGHFTESASAKNVKERWISKTDSLRAFVNTMVEESPGSRVNKKDFLEAYTEWCGEQGMIVYSERYIGLHLPRYAHTRTLETKPRSWANISVKGLEPLGMLEMREADLIGYDLSNEDYEDE